jgi:tryptophan synthase alpha chain
MLNKLKSENRVAFIPFVVVGDPNLAQTEAAIEILIEEGADLIELGVPFSDASADGPVIQTASERAALTTSLVDVLAFAKKILTKHPKFPFVLFTYYNPILRMGAEKFADAAKKAGIYAVLVVDLPPEEAEHYSATLAKHGVGAVFLASPTTPKSRIAEISKHSTAFIYYVSRAGVTGVQASVSQSLTSEVQAVRALTDRPIAVGFGISTGPQARQVSEIADAVVVGSAFVKILSSSLKAGETSALESFRSLAREIRTATLKR